MSYAKQNVSSDILFSSSSCKLFTVRYPLSTAEDLLNHEVLSDIVLRCERNRTVINYDNNYYAEAINYDNRTLRVVDRNVRQNDCSFLPRFHYAAMSTYRSSYFPEYVNSPSSFPEYVSRKLVQSVTYLSCEERVNSPRYIDTSPCINGTAFSQPGKKYHSYVVVGHLTFSDLEDSCRIDLVTLISSRNKHLTSYEQVHEELAYGFELLCPFHSFLFLNELWSLSRNIGQFLVRNRLVYIEIPRMLCIVLVILLLMYTWYKRHSSMFSGIEEFLESNNGLMPIRYSYWEVRIMTKFFREKLGEGGFGAVYKGKLSNGRLVAVKVLGKSKWNGQDFMNEVATIGRIHHVNVVHLIGFCATGSKRALVYDFMPNGSLEKYIFSKEGVISNEKSLSPKEILEISLGVSRGIGYLHQGCNMQILHFDIKPHNILLDENFVPKVSDFGLARTCPLEKSIVSMTAARGTLGYIAPEFFYKNIGGVSHKVDVYSFGMLLFEMASQRKNIRANAEKTSQIYFPTWIYDQFNEGNNVVVIEDATNDEIETVKKMIIVALWCIQMKPCDRPSMSKVIEMLEGDVESLEMPPKPCLYPREQENENLNCDDGEATESSWCSTPTYDNSAEIQ